jgi:hypothetical protein
MKLPGARLGDLIRRVLMQYASDTLADVDILVCALSCPTDQWRGERTLRILVVGCIG